jgi:hypothetical protein
MELEKLRSHKRSLMERIELLRTVQERLVDKRRQLQNLEGNKLDPELERARCREENKVQYQALGGHAIDSPFLVVIVKI